ncbi:MAG: RNA repair transcriptional activator RtcR, partial [Blastocatellia bacterium]
MNNKVVIGLLGATLDAGKGPERWERWRPTVSLCMHEELLIDRLELLHQPKFRSLAHLISRDVQSVSPETAVNLTEIDFEDPWDFEPVYATLHNYARTYSFDTDSEEYLVHITTGSHVAQICLFLLTESRHLPARLIQTAPPAGRQRSGPGQFEIIDLDLSKYDRIARRFEIERQEAASFLKSGIETRNRAFNKLIDRIEQVAINSRDPLLLMGPTGAGKSRLARRIYELKRTRHQMDGEFIEVSCATIRGDVAMSTLFGHVKGAYTGAMQARPGLLRAADHGVLFLDEIGALGSDEQAVMLKAIEEKSFLPLGADHEAISDFQLIAGTNSDLASAVREGKFREDLLSRINLWTFELPSLNQRSEDIEPNLQYELDEHARRTGRRVAFNKEARQRFLDFAVSGEARWTGNFRDLNAAIVRMATLAPGGRITVEIAQEEIDRLRALWSPRRSTGGEALIESLLGMHALQQIDPFDRFQLAGVVEVCKRSRSLSEAGRTLFAVSRG